MFLVSPKMGVYSVTAASWEKDTNFGATRNIFGPSYFVTALVIAKNLRVKADNLKTFEITRTSERSE